jgi:hypothetical protein
MITIPKNRILYNSDEISELNKLRNDGLVELKHSRDVYLRYVFKEDEDELIHRLKFPS